MFASVHVAPDEVGDVVEARLCVRFLGEAFSLTENVDEGSRVLAIGPGHRHHAALGMVARNACMIAVTASGASWVTR